MSSFCPNIDEWLFPQFEHVPPAVTDLRRNDIFIKFFFEFTLFVFLFQWFLVTIHFFKSFFFNAAGQVWDVPMIWQLGVPGDGYWSTRGLFSHASFIQKNFVKHYSDLKQILYRSYKNDESILRTLWCWVFQQFIKIPRDTNYVPL